MTPILDRWQSDDGAVTLLLGDCLQILPTLEAGSVDAVVTDPPFGIRFGIGNPGARGKYETHDDDPEEYPRLITGLVSECNRCVCDGGLSFVWQSMKNVARFAEWFPSGYRLFAAAKNFTQCRLTPVQFGWDPVVFWVNGKPRRWAIAGNRDFHVANTARFICEESTGHPCPRPIDTVQYIVELSAETIEIVADPFMGSGTTGVACIRTGRRFIGIEIEPKYFEIAKRRCIAELERFPLLEPKPLRQRELAEVLRVTKKLIDYDFTDIPDDQSTGLIEQTEDELLAAFAGLEWFDEICADEMIPRAEWKARSEATKAAYRATVARIYSQGRTSACVGFGTAQAVETTCTRRYGRKNWVPLAGMDVYSDIGRSLMSGAYIPDGMERISTIGCLPLRDPTTEGKYAVTFPGLEYGWNRPAGWKPVAGLFKVTKAAKAQGKEMIASALLKGRCGFYGRSRHCVPPVWLDFEGNTPLAAFANSWDKTWGDNGIGYDSERVFDSLIMYVILEVSFRPNIELPPLAA